MYWTFDNETGKIVSAKHEPIPSPEQEIYESKRERGGYCGTCEHQPCLVESGDACCHYAVKGWNCPHQPFVSAYGERESPSAYQEEDRLTRCDDLDNHPVRQTRSATHSWRPQRPLH